MLVSISRCEESNMSAKWWMAIALSITSFGIAEVARAENPEHVEQLLETGYCPYCDLTNADLSGLDLSNSVLRSASLIGANLSNTNLNYADLSNAILNAADLGGASFRFANLRNTSLAGARIQPPADLTGANLEDTMMPNGVLHNPSPAGTSDADAPEADATPSETPATPVEIPAELPRTPIELPAN